MKKLITIVACMALACSIAACKESSSGQDINTDVSEIAVLIDRGILTDAVWGVGEEIPADVSCVAGSQFEFNATDNPFFIASNDLSDPHFTTAAIITSSLNIDMPADEIGSRSDACTVGDLYYIISATPDIPIDIEFRGETCGNEIAFPSEPFLFPASGTVTAHVETEEVDLLAYSCQADETAAPEETNDVSENGNPESTNADDVVEDDVVEDDVVEDDVVEDDVVEDDVVEDDVVVEEEEEEVVDEPRRRRTKSAATTTKDDGTGCATLPVKMFKIVIDSCGAPADDVEVEVEAE